MTTRQVLQHVKVELNAELKAKGYQKEVPSHTHILCESVSTVSLRVAEPRRRCGRCCSAERISSNHSFEYRRSGPQKTYALIRCHRCATALSPIFPSVPFSIYPYVFLTLVADRRNIERLWHSGPGTATDLPHVSHLFLHSPVAA
jgi:hypothetical protein